MTKLTTSLINPFPDADVLGLDCETNGLDFNDNEIVCIAISDGNEGVVFDVRWDTRNPHSRPSPLRQRRIKRWLEKLVFNRKLVIHNASFDLGFLRQKYDITYPPAVWDTLLAEQLLQAGYENEYGLPVSCSLKDVVKRRYNVDLDKTQQTTFKLLGPITPEQAEYALHDVHYLPSLAHQQRVELSNEQLGVVWDIEKRALPVFAEMVKTGVNIDLDILNPLLDDKRDERDTLQTHLQTELGEYELARRIAKRDEMQDELDDWLERFNAAQEWNERHWCELLEADEMSASVEAYGEKILDETIDKKDGKPKGMKRYVKAQMKEWRVENPRPAPPRIDESPINLNSQQQVLAALGDVGIRLPDLQSKTIQAGLSEMDPSVRDTIAVPLLKYKKAEKLVTAFGEKLIEKISSDGRLRGNFRQIGTATGRPTCSTPNLLQIPSNKQFRRCFRAGEGKLMVVADYSQMELRILAELSGDRSMQTAFSEGLDLHSYTASLMFGIPIDEVPDQRRKVAKTIGFGICYGMGPNKLQATLAADGVYLTLDEAEKALEGWKASYPEAARWLESQQMHAITRGYTATPLGRRRRFDVKKGMGYRELGAIKRRGANFVIQGANADATKLAMSLVQENLSGRGVVTLQIYDEIVAEVDAEVALLALDVVRDAMIIAARTILTTVPVAVDAVVSYSWSEDDVVPQDELKGLYLLAG